MDKEIAHPVMCLNNGICVPVIVSSININTYHFTQCEHIFDCKHLVGD